MSAKSIDTSGPSGAVRREAGFALILAMLALMLLTFLGLTLAVTTSTELQIATNYRWSQQALYNAEAGVELGRHYLGTLEWTQIVWAPRNAANMSAEPAGWVARPGASGEASRNWENKDCDDPPLGGSIGYGAVFDHRTFASPFQNTSTFFGKNLGGSFTLWVRRPLVWNQAAERMVEDTNANSLILTSEGTAPFTTGSNFAIANRAMRYLEVKLDRIDPQDCENYDAQVGGGPTGSGYAGCKAIDRRGVPGATGEPGQNNQ